MSQPIVVELDLPDDLEGLRLPPGVNVRLQTLLDRQDRGDALTSEQKREAEGLVELAEGRWTPSHDELQEFLEKHDNIYV